MRKLKISTFIFVAIFCSTLFFFEDAFSQEKTTDKQKTWQELLTFLDKDFSNADKESKEKVNSLLDKIMPDRIDDGENEKTWRRIFWSPHLFKKISTPKGETRIVLLETQNLVLLPGQQTHFIHFFTKDGTLLGTTDFTTGWRMMASDFSITKSNELNCYLLQLKSGGFGSFAFADSSRQYYALLSDSALLLRLESSDEQKERNNRNSYGCKYPSIGSPIKQRIANEWITLLNSGDKIEVLQALMWMSGIHYSLDYLQKNDEQERKMAQNNPDEKFESILQRCPEAAQDAKIFSEIQTREDVKIMLKNLTGSQNEWIREAAELALKPFIRSR